MVKMRYDMFICFFIACLLLLAINGIGNKYIESRTAAAEEEKIISSSEIGGQADETIPVVTSLEDMREHSRFTVELSRDVSYDVDYVYAEKHLWQVLELESGEKVLADVYSPSIQYNEGSSVFDYTKLYPVGKLVEKGLTQEMLGSAESEGIELTVTDCYIDMADGNNNPYDPTAATVVTNILMFAVPVAAFILLHRAGVKMGFFPPIIPKKENQADVPLN